MLVSLIAASVLVVVNVVCVEANSPIIIVPGMMGSQIFMKKRDVRRGSLRDRLPLDANHCLKQSALDDLTLVYDKARGLAVSKTGADITVEFSADTCDVEYLTANRRCSGATPGSEDGGDDDYFHTFVEHYVAKGYERGKTIRSAPYDWRLAPAQLTQYYDKLRRMVQDIYLNRESIRQFKKVTLVAHGIGAPIVLYFLNTFVDKQWKDTYINSFITLSGAWSGSNGVVETIVSGRKLTALAPLVDNGCQPSEDLRRLYINAARTFSGVMYALPKPSVWDKQIIVTSDPHTYTSSGRDYATLFYDLKSYPTEDVYNVFKQNDEDKDLPARAPEVATYCFYGIGVNTPETFKYGSGLYDSASATVINGDGDGTVNRRSAEVCLRWERSQGPRKTFVGVVFPGVDYTSIVKNVNVLHEIDKLVLPALPVIPDRP